MSDTVTITQAAEDLLASIERHYSMLTVSASTVDSLRAALDTPAPEQSQVSSVPPVAYVREQEGTETELFATVEEAMGGPYEFDGDHDASAGDPWYVDCSSESGDPSRWSACPVGEPAVYIHEHEIPAGCLPKPAEQVSSVLSDEDRKVLRFAADELDELSGHHGFQARIDSTRSLSEKVRKLAEHPSSGRELEAAPGSHGVGTSEAPGAASNSLVGDQLREWLRSDEAVEILARGIYEYSDRAEGSNWSTWAELTAKAKAGWLATAGDFLAALADKAPADPEGDGQ